VDNSSVLAVKALDGLSARSIVTAENIANAGTPGYRPLKVTFEEALITAARGGSAREIAGVRPKVETQKGPAGDSGLRLDLELATASSTAMRYAALIEVLNRQMQVHALAVSGSR